MATSVTPRVFELLAEARRALALRGRLRGAGKDVSAVEEALEGLYRDLGREVVHAAEARDGLVFPTVRRLDPTDYDFADKETESWYSEETTPRGPMLVEPFFERGDDTTDIPEPDELVQSTPVLPVDRERTDSEGRLAEYLVATIDAAERAAQSPTSAIRALGAEELPVWFPRVRELRTLLTLPESFTDPDDLKIEVARLQWATSELGHRLDGLPAEIQLLVLGLLAARAQHIRGRVDNDVAPRIVIDRLQRYRVGASLPTVAALLPTPRPERGGWVEDTRAWWELLRGAP